MATVTSLYIYISYIYTYLYNFNSLSSYIPIACQSFSVTCSMSLAYPLSILFLYSYFYTLHIPIFIMCSSFTLVICLFNVPILFQVTYHVSFHVVATRPCYTIHFLNIVLSYIFLYYLVLSYCTPLYFHLVLFIS